jgi:tetratricopeptide (TPR) repeat protein
MPLTSSEDWYYVGLNSFNAKNYCDAIDSLKNARKLSPYDAHIRFILGRAYHKCKPPNFREALSELEEALNIDENNPDFHFYFGFVYWENLIHTVKQMQKFKTVDDIYKTFYIDGIIFPDTGEFDLNSKMEDVKYDDEYHKILQNYKNLYDIKNIPRSDFQKIIFHYCRAIQLNDKNPLWHHNLGTIYFFLGDTEDAIREFRISSKLDPSIIEPRFSLLIIKCIQKKYSDVLDILEEIFNYSSKGKKVVEFHLLYTFIQMIIDGDIKSIISHLKKAIQLENNWEYREILLVVYFSQGLFKEGYAIFDKSDDISEWICDEGEDFDSVVDHDPKILLLDYYYRRMIDSIRKGINEVDKTTKTLENTDNNDSPQTASVFNNPMRKAIEKEKLRLRIEQVEIKIRQTITQRLELKSHKCEDFLNTLDMKIDDPLKDKLELRKRINKKLQSRINMEKAKYPQISKSYSTGNIDLISKLDFSDYELIIGRCW